MTSQPAKTITKVDAALLVLLVAILIAQVLPVISPGVSWEDETLHVSTSLALLQGQVNPTVLRDFPATHTLLKFYGPVTFWLGEGCIKLFGLSKATWRIFAFSGNILFYFAAYLALTTLGLSRRTALFGLIVLSLSIEESLGATTCGRTDILAIGGVLLGVVLLLKSLDATGKRRFLTSMLGGAIAGVFLVCTPRSWLLWFACSSVIAFSILIRSAPRADRLWSILMANLAALAAMWAVLLPIHLNPFTFVRGVQRATEHDTVNASPLLGGSWGFGGTKTQIIFYAVLVMLLALLSFRKLVASQSRSLVLLFTTISLVSAMLQIALLARSFNTSIYWGPLILLSAIAAVTQAWGQVRTRPLLRWLVGGVCCVLLIFMATLRVSRLTQSYLTVAGNDSARMEQMLVRDVPPGSVVYGPVGPSYFFLVEKAGSDYRYATEQTTPGLASVPYNIHTESPLAPTLCSYSAFVLWPENSYAMPGNLELAVAFKMEEQPPETERHMGLRRLLSHVPAGRVEAPVTGASLYRLKVPDGEACRSDNGVDGLRRQGGGPVGF